MLIFPIL